ncbi:MAG: septum formation initiator family protein [Clostridiales bacterium]|nr:septum formation initiator family protein [Clostridiales bacterium]
METKKRKRRWRWRRLLILAVAVFAAFNLLEQQARLHYVKSQTREVQIRLQRVQEENDILRQKLLELQNPALLEQEARRQGLIKEGEVVYEPVWQEEETHGP